MPFVQCLARSAVLLVLQHILHDVAEISVAGHHDGLFEVQRGTVVVAAELMLSVRITLVAGISVFRFEDALLKANKTVYEFENGAWRIWRLHGPVEHRLVRIAYDFAVVLSYVGEHLHVDTRAGHHCQNLSCGRFDGHETAHLVLHQHLAVLLEVCIDGGDHVFSRYGFLVELPVLVT